MRCISCLHSSKTALSDFKLYLFIDFVLFFYINVSTIILLDKAVTIFWLDLVDFALKKRMQYTPLMHLVLWCDYCLRFFSPLKSSQLWAHRSISSNDFEVAVCCFSMAV